MTRPTLLPPLPQKLCNENKDVSHTLVLLFGVQEASLDKEEEVTAAMELTRLLQEEHRASTRLLRSAGVREDMPATYTSWKQLSTRKSQRNTLAVSQVRCGVSPTNAHLIH